ncbi:MAG: hypothetical protein JNJ99_10100 [Crocinitomicaceae bacterium]|nr:hypothetical protein [Crocinitomicaceae bacterium]
MINLFKTAVVVTAVFVLETTYSQKETFLKVLENECDWNETYIGLLREETLFLDAGSSEIIDCKISASKCAVRSDFHGNRYQITPLKTGSIHVKAKIEYKNGSKEKLKREFISVELPELCLDLSHSTPDHQFIWLELKEVSENKIVNDDYEICLMKFTLSDSTGKIKTSGIVQTESDFFPSISLKEFNSTFELGDELIIQMIIIHKEYDLPVGVESSTLIIDKLWH